MTFAELVEVTAATSGLTAKATRKMLVRLFQRLREETLEHGRPTRIPKFGVFLQRRHKPKRYVAPDHREGVSPARLYLSFKASKHARRNA